MGSNVIIGIVIGLVILAAVLYLIGYLMKKKNQERLKELDKRKEALFDLPVVEEVDEVKKCILSAKVKILSVNGIKSGQMFRRNLLLSLKVKSLKLKAKMRPSVL